MLHGLVSRSIFSVTHRIVSEHEDRRQFHQGREPDRRPLVVAEDEERRAVRPDLREGQPVQDGAHRVFADAEVQILPSRAIRLEMAGAFIGQQRLVRWSEVGRSAQEPREHSAPER